MCRVHLLLVTFALSVSSAYAEDSPPFLLQWGEPGSGPGQFNQATGIAIDAVGHVFVCEDQNARVQVFDTHGTYLTQWGSYGSEPGQFLSPSGIDADAAGRVYVSDRLTHSVSIFDLNGGFLSRFGVLPYPVGVAVNGAGDVFSPSSELGNVGRWSDTGDFINIVAGGIPTPHGVGTDAAGNLYVCQAGAASRVLVYDPTGHLLRTWGTTGFGAGQFTNPIDVAVDVEGNVYVVDWSPRVQKFTSDGVFLTQWGSSGLGPGQFYEPFSIAVDAQGNVYVSDRSGRIQKFGSAPTATSKGSWGRIKALYR